MLYIHTYTIIMIYRCVVVGVAFLPSSSGVRTGLCLLNAEISPLDMDIMDMMKIYEASTKYPLVMTNIAMENGPFIDGLPGFTY